MIGQIYKKKLKKYFTMGEGTGNRKSNPAMKDNRTVLKEKKRKIANALF